MSGGSSSIVVINIHEKELREQARIGAETKTGPRITYGVPNAAPLT